MIESANVEIRNQPHLMAAEGTDDKKPVGKEIVEYLLKRGYISNNIDIWFDNMQGFWRWNCDIKPKGNT